MAHQSINRRELLGLLAVTVTPAWAADAVASSRKEAEAWLALVDDANYQQSWENAASFFKERVSSDQWKQAASSVRDPLGKLVSREFLRAQQTNKLPGAPDGDYVVIQYRASFANKKDAVETITPMKDTDGAWCVSGYYVR